MNSVDFTPPVASLPIGRSASLSMLPRGRIMGGAALFGVGWGHGGSCPGPGLTAAISGAVAAMVAGMVLFHLLNAWTQTAR